MHVEGVGGHHVQGGEEDEVVGQSTKLDRVIWTCEFNLSVCVCVNVECDKLALNSMLMSSQSV